MVEGRRQARPRPPLRRLDWRFLLPGVPPVNVADGGSSALERAARELWMVAESAADLAVAVNPDGRKIEACRRQLRDGGALYAEWTRPVLGGKRRILRWFRDASLADAACYWMWPPPGRRSAQFWVPLDSPNAIDFFLKTRPPEARRPLAALGRRGLRAIWRLAFRAGGLSPVCAIGRCASDGEERDLVEELRDGWSELGLGRKPGVLHRLLLAPGTSDLNKAIAFLFPDDEHHPRAVVKFARDGDGAAGLEREAANLDLLASQSGLPPGVPRLLLHRQARPAAVVETPLVGRPLYAVLRRRSFERLCHSVTDWLVDLARVAPISTAAARAADAQLLYDCEIAFARVASNAQIDASRDLVSSLHSARPVWEHRDCSPWNVLVDEAGRISVPDWESATSAGVPGSDLVYFLTFAALFVDGAMDSRARQLDSFHTVWDSSSETGQVAAECCDRYATTVGLSPQLIRAVRVRAWMIHSRSGQGSLENGLDDASAFGSSLFFALWLAELDARWSSPGLP